MPTSTTQVLPDLIVLAETLASMPPGTVFSHRTAAQLCGMWIPRFDGIEVTTPANHRGSRHTTSVQRRAVTAHRMLLDDADVIEYFGLPVLAPARTWTDLAPLLDIYDLVAAGDSALRAGADEDDIARRAAQLRRRRGAVKARRAAAYVNERSRSRPESRIRAAIVLAGLPEPDVNSVITDEYGQWLAEPDLSYREAKIALEYNGADHEGERRMRKDATRLLGVQRCDWEVRTYTAVDAYHRLDDVVRDVHALLSRRAPQLLTARYRTR